MNTTQSSRIQITLDQLFKDSKYDHIRMIKGVAKSVFRPVQPNDFEHVYLSISKEQGSDLVALIKQRNFKNIVEFGTSFGISTLFLAQGVQQTGGHVITTELIASKAQKAIENFQKAGVSHLIDVRIGDALETLKDHNEPIDLLLLDGWKDLYLPLFQLLERNFHENTIVYVDNADMEEVQTFLRTVSRNPKYLLQSQHQGKVALISKN